MENSYLIRSGKLCALSCGLILGTFGCQEPPTAVALVAEEAPPEVGLYASLAGKMARMEELLNAIERFLGDPDFQQRLLEDAQEFAQLVEESRLLFPDELEPEDQEGYVRAMDATLGHALELKSAITAENVETAQVALSKLHQVRKKSHARYSY